MSAAGEAVTLHLEGPVATVTLTQPALGVAAKQDLLAALRQVGDDPAVRAVVLTGTGRVFCAGQDLKEHAAALDADAGHALDTLPHHFHPLVEALTGTPKPVVAAINGACAGAGLSLALACDLRVCADTARLTTAFTGIGLTADSGMSMTLARAVGAARASELLMLAEPFTAQQALDWGLVGRVVAADDLAGEAAGLARRLAAGPTLAYAELKAVLHAAATAPLRDVLALEYGAQVRLGLTADHRGAVAAFLAKERPSFRGE